MKKRGVRHRLSPGADSNAERMVPVTEYLDGMPEIDRNNPGADDKLFHSFSQWEYVFTPTVSRGARPTPKRLTDGKGAQREGTEKKFSRW